MRPLGKRTRLALVSRDDLRDPRVASGFPSSMVAALSAQDAEVLPCDRLGYPRDLLSRVENRVLKFFGLTEYFRWGVARRYDRVIRERLRSLRPVDAIVFVDALVPGAAFRGGPEPTVYVSDATYGQLIELDYPGYGGLAPRTRRQVRKLEAALFSRMDHLCFSSEWAARAATKDAGAPRTKVSVIPWGANLEVPPDASIAQARDLRNGVCEMLFIGVHWHRKGGPVAAEIVAELNRTGIPSRLTVCGTKPPLPEGEQLRVFPFLDKTREDHRRILHDLFSTATYLLLPTRADCTPIVFCEAFAYGLPVITSDVGGVSEIVEHGQTGFVLPLGAAAADYVQQIAAARITAGRYAEMCRAARRSYESTFNWARWATGMLERVACLGHERARGLPQALAG